MRLSGTLFGSQVGARKEDNPRWDGATIREYGAEAKAVPCLNCGGEGWYVDHSDDCYANSECVGCGGVQRECECGGGG